MTKEKKYIVDTSVVIERIVSNLVKKKEIKGIILIPHAVISELENQANKGLEIGFLGLEEIQELRTLNDIKIEFIGNRPNETQIKFAKSGEIDAYIRELAYQQNAILITADLVQAESGKAFGLEVKYIEPKQPKEKLEIEKFFDEHTMSVHLKQDCPPYGKKGKPGSWQLVKIGEEKLTAKKIQEIQKEVVEKSRIDPKTFIEISRRGSTIIQYKDYRIVNVRPPVSDGYEITAVKPLKYLSLDYYDVPEPILKRLREKATGILIVGEVGSGKSTFCQALAEEFFKLHKIVKTVESPRDLQLPDEITQYSKNFANSEELHDILFLSRPDVIVFDEIRDTEDFKLFADLKLGASNVVGVLHASTPIDAIQRFISRLDVGMIPSIVDTILFIGAGNLEHVYTVLMVVKTPTGMTEADLARPVVEVRDFKDGSLKYEIYSYGEQTVVIPIEEETKKGIKSLAAKYIEQEFKKYTSKSDITIVSDSKAVVYVPEKDIAHIIGAKGKTIEAIEQKLGIGLEIQELKTAKQNVDYNIQEDKNHITFYVDPGLNVDIFVEDKYIFTAISSKKGMVKIHKKSNLGRDILKALSNKRKIELKV